MVLVRVDVVLSQTRTPLYARLTVMYQTSPSVSIISDNQVQEQIAIISSINHKHGEFCTLVDSVWSAPARLVLLRLALCCFRGRAGGQAKSTGSPFPRFPPDGADAHLVLDGGSNFPAV